MAKNTTAYYTKSGRFSGTGNIISATTLFTPGADGSKVLNFYITSLSGGYSANVVINSVIYIIPAASLVANVPLDILTYLNMPVNGNNQRYINLEPSALIVISSSGFITGTIYAEDY